jgi:hypothetical protein
MTQYFINNNEFNFKTLKFWNFTYDIHILLYSILIITSTGIYLSSSAKKTIIDIGTKVGTAVLTGAAAGVTKSVSDKIMNDDNDKNKDKEKEKENTEEKQTTSVNSK